MRIIQEYAGEFSTGDWILMLVANILLLAIIVIALIFLVRLLRRLFRFRVPVKEHEELVKQVKDLQRDLLRSNYEKDKLIQMKMAELGMCQQDIEKQLADGEEPEEFVPSDNRNTLKSPCVDPEDSRFFRLTMVDNYYKTEYQPPVYDNTITLPEFCERFRKFAASELGLYYDISMMRSFLAAMGTARIIILQGISGTGKTSLAYAFGKFVGKDTSLVPVQPAWRERTELYGYYNEFTKKYTETEFLKAIYEANYYRDPHLVILDEMNIARVEYYFAEMLSILEMPIKSDWKVDVVSAVWDNDPCLIDNGAIPISDNVWFVGTINNDDSTFSVSDKVYDRAFVINLDSKGIPFEAPKTPAKKIAYSEVERLYEQAKQDFPVSREALDKIEKLDLYVIQHFRIAFGNRIMKQLKDFVPVYIACGGTETEAIDYIFVTKVFRKFESLNLSLIRGEIRGLIAMMDSLFGPGAMAESIEYLQRLQKMY